MNDFKSLQRHTRTYQAVYSDISRYPLPGDMKQEALSNIQKYFGSDTVSTSHDLSTTRKYRKVSPNVFKTYSEENVIAFDYSDGLAWLLGNFQSNLSSTVLHNLDSITDDGTWAVADNGTNLVANTFNYIAGSGSLSVDLLAGGTTLSLVNSSFEAMDISDCNKLFLWVYLPTKENLTSITLLYGNDAITYYTTSATIPFDVTEFHLGWNLVAFDRGTATGTVDLENIDYAKISLSFSATPTTLTGFLFDSLLASTGDAVELTYYSRYPWKDTAGNWKESSAADTDILNVTEEEYNIMLCKVAYEAAKSIPLSDTQITLLEKDYVLAKQSYFNKHPSRRYKEQNYLYRPMNVSKK